MTLPLPPPAPSSSPMRGWWRPWWLSWWSIFAVVISRREVPAEHQRMARLLGRTWEGLVAFFICVAAQVPLGAFQFMMRSEGSTFPASICAMFSVYLVLTLMDKCRPGLGLDRFYTLHLGPAVRALYFLSLVMFRLGTCTLLAPHLRFTTFVAGGNMQQLT